MSRNPNTVTANPTVKMNQTRKHAVRLDDNHNITDNDYDDDNDDDDDDDDDDYTLHFAHDVYCYDLVIKRRKV